MRALRLFTLLGVATVVTGTSAASFAIAVFGLAGLAAAWSGLALDQALAAGLLAALGMFLSEWLHQMGHALAARRVGYPMHQMLFTSILAVSQYPADEPELPARVHVQRALGGFWVNLLVGAFLLPYWFFLSFAGGAAAWALGWLAFWNLAVLGLGALAPIDIPGVLTTDGATLLRYGRKMTDG